MCDLTKEILKLIREIGAVYATILSLILIIILLIRFMIKNASNKNKDLEYNNSSFKIELDRLEKFNNDKNKIIKLNKFFNLSCSIHNLHMDTDFELLCEAICTDNNKYTERLTDFSKNFKLPEDTSRYKRTREDLRKVASKNDYIKNYNDFIDDMDELISHYEQDK
ncbi:MAG: hypothetical protein EOM53_04275 [Alphaproteobacteria bacterium]|nr:hypothetical protein [Alphaproteobacteria bacterium]